MENTLENKEKFFAQYYGQTLQIDTDLEGGKYPLTISNIAFEPEKCHLQLKPSSLITEEEALEIGNICLGTEYNKKEINIYGGNVIDYLRSKGYAVPWMGLSVEKLQEYGWIKLVN